jgi:2-dehydropantoate 2-reductase
VLHHIAEGSIRLGEFRGKPRPRTHQIAEWLRSSGIPCEVLEDLRWGRWAKLVWNIPFNGLGAVLDLPTDRLLATEEGLHLVRALMAEVIAAAEALGLRMPADMIDRQIAHTRDMGSYRTSMQIDRSNGRPLEVEAILGEPLRQAQRAGVSTPRLLTLYELASLVGTIFAGQPVHS